jgi:membrane-associated phospholipid phosphatase
MIRGLVLAGLLVAAVVPLAGCGKDIKLKSYDPAAEPTAAKWRTWLIGNPARLSVPPPPAANSAKTKRETSELERIAEKRTLAEEREARFWALEPTVRPWIATGLNQWTHRNRHDPVAAARSYALLSVAMYDATIAAWHWKYRYKRKVPPEESLFPPGKEPSYPSEHAAIAGAAARVLSYVFGEKKPAEFEDLAQEAARSRIVAGANYRSDVEAGLQLGRKVGDAVVNRAKADGSSRAWNGVRPRGRGFWEPPPGSNARPIQPVAGSWRPWVLSSGSQFRPPGPPRFDSPEMKTQTQRVVAAGRRLSRRRQRVATRWEGGAGTPQVPGTWNQVALTRVDRRNLSIPRTARMFALLNVGMADAGIAAWDARYTYWFPRPQNAARDLGIARRWKPFLSTPASPSYVSGHSAFSSAASQILSYVFPDTAGRFRSQAAQAGRSAIYGGIQFPFSDEAGRRIGGQVADRVIGRARGDGASR